ncbi:MAG: SRPBCC domain-containing protein [Elusimicrobia bacterium]|nr:SRPBCC domain-containing protein [Elusimicrobiota bacterium]MDE2511618.1 SRPBCC domain-containing protein [Elusimicrobiota bacterium]
MPAAVPRRHLLKTRDVRFAVKLRAEPAAVYQALTSARELTRWWLLGAETDARNAGRVRMVWPRVRRGDGTRCDGLGEREGVFVDLEPGKKVAWLFKPARGDRRAPPLVSVFIDKRRGGCEVTLLHAGFKSAPSYDELCQGYACAWEDGLAKLKLYLETGRTCKMESMDLETARILTRPRR